MVEFPDSVTCSDASTSSGGKKHPYIGLPMDEVFKRQGYPLKTHTVTTEDGYKLKLKVFRIPYSDKSPLVEGEKKKAVYLNHGMTANGQEFILQWGDRSLGFLLADSGFDVFFGNARGTKYSLGHTNKTISEEDYWDFSWDKLGRYDVSAVISIILSGTKTGTTEYFVALSEIPELNDKIYTGILFTSVAFLGHSTSPVRYLVPLAANRQYWKQPYLGGKHKNAQDQMKMFNMQTLSTHFEEFCSPVPIDCLACSNMYFLLAGYDCPQTNFTEVPMELAAFPDRTSTKDDYDLSQITAPTVFFGAECDQLCVPKDVAFTGSKLGKGALKENIIVKYKQFTHEDFATAIHAKELVYDQVLSFMKEGTYEPSQ